MSESDEQRVMYDGIIDGKPGQSHPEREVLAEYETLNTQPGIHEARWASDGRE